MSTGKIVEPRGAGVSWGRACLVLALVLLIGEATAQQPSRVPQIGYLSYGFPAESANRVTALRMGLRDHGYVEGKNISLVFRWAETADRLPELAPGGLMSYFSDLEDTTRRAATYIDKILRGTRPADLPVEQASKYELIINLKTAKALGITVPPSVLQRADRILH
jgi:hypothetical protein